MRGLTIIVVGGDPERFHAALTFAAAAAAMGRDIRLHVHAPGVPLLADPRWEQDTRYGASGLPTLAGLLDDALALGVAISACQSGLALFGLNASGLDGRISLGGPIAALSRDDQFLTF
jgi:predicted peroxiredoxin